MIFITQEEDLKVESEFYALYFYANWMPFHEKMMTMIDKVEAKYKNLTFLAVDSDHFEGLCRRFKVEAIPTVIILKEGLEIKRINGLTLTSAFKSAFADICNS